MKYIPYLNFKSFYFEITCTIFVLIALLINPVLAQKAENQTPKNQINHSDLSDSLDKNIQTEKEDIKQLNETLKNVQRLGKSMDVEMNAYMIQIPAYNTLLHAATTEIDDLQKAWLNNRDALEAITATLKELNQKRNVIDQLQIQTNEQYTLNQKKLSEIKSKSSIIESSLKKLQILTQILSNKQELLDKIKKIHTEQISKLNIIQQDFIVFAEKFDNRIKERKKQELFQRKAGQLTLL